MPTGRFYLFIFLLAFLFATLYFIVMYVINAMRKRALGKISVLHEFEDEKAGVDVEALKKQKDAELKKYRESKIGKERKHGKK